MKKIYVTQPALPPLDELIELLKDIWESKCLTNNGKFHQQFEKELAEFLGVKYVSLFANGTLALQTALQTLRITGEVITTPFSFVATTHALWWNNIKPVFVDIESETFTLDPEKIEMAISPQTTAILPVHVYGFPCKVEQIKSIAETYGLKVIYDAAHTFGARLSGTSLCAFGDLSVLSFHATKIFNTFEGGAIVCHDIRTKQRIDYLKNFGFAGETTVIAPGINAKMNEFQAALGVLQLKYFDDFVIKRREIDKIYQKGFEHVQGIKIPQTAPEVDNNYAYFPILIQKEVYGRSRDELYNALIEYGIYSRRYFYPLISQFPTYRGLPSAKSDNIPVAEEITQRIICLPIYPDLSISTVDSIINFIKKYGKQ